MEKNGIAEYEIHDNQTKKRWKEYPSERLTSIQEKQMSFQPDMIWQYAQYLKEIYKKEGIQDVSIYVNTWVSLNGRPSRTYIDFNKDLLEIKKVDEIYDYVLE